ncbi:MAG: hypothetical protein KC478_13215 [Bacteriovoracaceae bacterium]|nr:hypothetical protein [Bacteriovoracaceae bacterium]
MLLRFALVLLILSSNTLIFAAENIVKNNSVNFKDVLLELSSTSGLENLEVKTLIDEQDFQNFITTIFKTPYVVPNFCLQLNSFQGTSIWNLPDSEIVSSCRDELLSLIDPLLTQKYVVRTFIYSGHNKEGNFYKARLMAEDLRHKRSFMVELDLVLD